MQAASEISTSEFSLQGNDVTSMALDTDISAIDYNPNDEEDFIRRLPQKKTDYSNASIDSVPAVSASTGTIN